MAATALPRSGEYEVSGIFVQRWLALCTQLCGGLLVRLYDDRYVLMFRWCAVSMLAV